MACGAPTRVPGAGAPQANLHKAKLLITKLLTDQLPESKLRATIF